MDDCVTVFEKRVDLTFEFRRDGVTLGEKFEQILDRRLESRRGDRAHRKFSVFRLGNQAEELHADDEHDLELL